MYVFGEFYDETLELLAQGACSVFVPVVGGVYRAVYAPATPRVRTNMLNDPIGFALTATKKTREFAEYKGLLLEDY